MNLNKKLIAIGILSLLSISLSAHSDESQCGPSSEGVSVDNESPLFSLSSRTYQEEDLPPAFQMALYDAEMKYYKEKLQIIDAALFEISISHLAKERATTTESLKAELLAPPSISDEDVNAFYEANKARIAYKLEQVREQIREMLVRNSVQSTRVAVIDNAKKQNEFKVFFGRPIAPFVEITTDGFPSKGSAKPKVTLVEFADYQCPHCKNAASSIKNILGRFEDELRVVYMDFPINASGISRAVAKGGVCADQQDSFWPYHDLAFEKQEKLNHDSPLNLAEELGLDTAQFKTCFDSMQPEERLSKSEQEALRLGLTSTPTLFLNGRRLHLHDLENELEQEIEKALAAES